MRTAIEVLDWAVQYKDIAGDGFKAEMLWLAHVSGNQGHEAGQGLTFQESAWEAFASALDPDQYQSGWICDYAGYDYDALQHQAVCAFRRSQEFTTPVTGDLNERTHKVIWNSGFGMRFVSNVAAKTDLYQDLQNDLSNDDKAKVYLALVLLGESAQQPEGILNQQLEPQTYHEILCVLVANYLKEKLQ